MAEGWTDDDRSRAQARVGSTLGKYTIDALLGVGGMAAVYRATHRNGAVFALKVLHPEYAARRDIRARFLREGYLANSVKHPGVVRVVDDEEASTGEVYIVMDLLLGLSVDRLTSRLGGRLPVRAAVALGLALLDVLVAAHTAGVIHRDIKPANVFVGFDGRMMLLDFGIARAYDTLGGHATVDGAILGTPAFMAPEQAAGDRKLIGARSDLWSAAATMFTAMAGRTVHVAESGGQFLVLAATRHARPLREVMADAPDSIAAVIDRALSLDPEARWADAAQMREALASSARELWGSLPGPADLALLVAPLRQAESLDDGQAPTEIANPATTPSSQTTSPPIADVFFRAVTKVMRGLGVDVDGALEASGIDAAQPVDAARRVAFFEHCARLAGDPSLGVKAGFLMPLGSSGPVDYASRTSSTFGDAFARASRLFAALSDRISLVVEEEGDLAHIRVRRPADAPSGPQISEFTIATLLLRAREALHSNVPVISIGFAHARVPGCADLSAELGGPIRYEQPCDEIVVPRSLLSAQLEASDPAMADMLERHTQRLGRPT